MGLLKTNICEFNWPKDPQLVYACIKCGQTVTHEQVREFKRLNAVLFCKKKENS